MCTKYHRELVYQLPPMILSKESCSWLQKSYKSANKFETDKVGYDSPSSWQASNRMRQPLLQQHLNRELQKLEECTSPSSPVILFLSNLLLEHLNHPIYSLLRVLQNKCVRSATFAHLNNGRQKNTFWQTFSSNYMLAEYVFPFPHLLCYKQLCEQFLQTNSSCKQD